MSLAEKIREILNDAIETGCKYIGDCMGNCTECAEMRILTAIEDYDERLEVDCPYNAISWRRIFGDGVSATKTAFKEGLR